MLGFCDGRIFGDGIPILVFEFNPAFGAVIPGETQGWEQLMVKCSDSGY